MEVIKGIVNVKEKESKYLVIWGKILSIKSHKKIIWTEKEWRITELEYRIKYRIHKISSSCKLYHFEDLNGKGLEKKFYQEVQKLKNL